MSGSEAESSAAVEKVAILGGGLGALTTAWHLTQGPIQGRYEVTVYQMGWRLGGKCASGRTREVMPDGTELNRSLEHGIHYLAGCYENAFEMLDDCYRELNRGPDEPLSTCFPDGDRDPAFQPLRNGPGSDPSSALSLLEQRAGKWSIWEFAMPEMPGVPGERSRRGDRGGTLWDYVQGILAWLTARLDDGSEKREELARQAPAGVQTDLEAAAEASGVEGRLHIAERLGAAPGAQQDAARHRTLHWLLSEVAEKHGARQDFTNETQERQFWLEVRFALSIAQGILADGLVVTGLDHVDDVEFSDWLRRHGAGDDVVDSALVRALYAVPIAYDPREESQRCLSAAVAVRFVLRLFLDYRGAFAWKMQAGMGETVIAPLYLALKQRGVRFRFFHKVESLRVEGDRVAGIGLRQQVDPREGEDLAAYDPLIPIRDPRGILPCWPDQARLEWIRPDQAAELQRLRQEAGIDLESDAMPARADWGRDVVLQVDEDFDRVVLAIPIGALRGVADDLIRKSRRWAAMLAPDREDSIRTIQTLNAQLWFRKSVRELGWDGAHPLIELGYERPVDTWADYDQVRKRENLPDDVQHLGYLLDSLQDPDTEEAALPLAQREEVRRRVIQFLETRSGTFWPAAWKDGRFDPSFLADFGPGPIDSQYFRANINGSDRYVLSVPGSSRRRLRADESGFANLVLAGDWIDNGINVGAVESTVTSGKQASRALSGSPRTIYAEWDGFPGVMPRLPEPKPRVFCTAEWVPGDERESPIHYRGAFDGWVFLLEVELTAVREALPHFVNLTARRDIPEAIRPRPGRHPVVVMCGRYSGVCSVPPIPLLPQNLRYLECATVVPYAAGCGPTPKNYPVCVELVDPRAVALGWAGAINKGFARLGMREDSFVVDEIFDFPGTPMLRLKERARRPLNGNAPPALRAIRDLFGHPLFGSYTDSIKTGLGLEDRVPLALTQVCVPARFDLGVEIAATDLEVEVGRGFRGPAAGGGAIEGIDRSGYGAFWMSGCQWELHPPSKC